MNVQRLEEPDAYGFAGKLDWKKFCSASSLSKLVIDHGRQKCIQQQPHP